ncbi:MAG: phasin family protein [Pseudomonadota bacterium]
MSTTANPFAFQGFDPKAFAGFFPVPDSMGTMARGAMEASTQSARASMKGMQELGQSFMTGMKQHMTLGVETGKKLSEVESLEDALALQASYMKTAFEANMKGFTEMSELYAETLREAFAPIAKQAKKAAKSAAA